MYLLRLDDAAEYLNKQNWLLIEELLDKYSIKPIVGVIPAVEDAELKEYDYCPNIWEKVNSWQKKGWTIALHGYSHVFETKDGGINPVNKKSEFAGLSLNIQRRKIREGYRILSDKGIQPTVFFAPAHTFDNNTLIAIKNETPIRIISDTISNDLYFCDDLFFIPQQPGRVRNLPLKLVTFCYHPNKMTKDDFQRLDRFLLQNQTKFGSCSDIAFTKRKKNLLDILLSKLYFIRK